MKWFGFIMITAGLWALIHFIEMLIVLNLKTNNNNERHLISLYEDLDTSNDFKIIHYPLPTKPKVQYTPKVSIRGCNIQKPKNKNANKVIWGNIRTQLSLNEQRKHCLSALTDTPIRYEIKNEQPLFVLHATNARIHGNGIVQTVNEDLIYKRSCFGSGYIDEYDSTYYGEQYSSLHCTQSVDNLIVASQPWGYETGHFVSNTLPRILPYLDLAQTMPIHLSGRYDTAQSHAWFDYLNLTSIRGDQICATNVYVASPSDCRGGAYMSNMHLRTREVAIASTNHPLVTDEDEKIVLILHRDNSEDGREPIRNINRLVVAMHEAGYENIKVMNDTDTEFWSCVSCQLEVYKKTWLFIASHGAGLINLLFMSEGTYVVEIASLYRPEEPYYSEVGQMTYTLGQHYYHYYWQNIKEDSTNLDVKFFISELEDWAPPSARYNNDTARRRDG